MMDQLMYVKMMEKQPICRNIRCSVARPTRLLRLNLIQCISYFFHFSSYFHTCWSFSIIRESYSSPQCLEYGDLAAPLLKNVVKRRGEMLVLPVISVLDLSLSSVVRSVRTSCG